MKIASIITESLLKPGGYEIFTYNLLTLFSEGGHDVTLYVTDREYGKHTSFYKDLPFKVRPLIWKCMSAFKRFPALVTWWLRKQQQKHRYDLWQVMGAYPEAAMVQGLTGSVPLILRTHGDDIQAIPELNYGLRLDPQKDRSIRKALRAMDSVIALTPGIEDDLRELGVPENKIATIPNGISFDYLSNYRDRNSCREKWEFRKTPSSSSVLDATTPKKASTSYLKLLPT